jgi:hypothetical protein
MILITGLVRGFQAKNLCKDLVTGRSLKCSISKRKTRRGAAQNTKNYLIPDEAGMGTRQL